METNVVDPSLNKMLLDDLPVSEKRNLNSVESEQFDLSEDEEDLAITDNTKNMISSLLMSSVSGSPEMTVKIVNILNSLEQLTEKQGLLYLKAIQASDMTQVNSQAVTMILQIGINGFFAPDWPEEEKKKVLADKYVRASVSNLLSGLFYRLGHWSGAILFFLYCLKSYNFPFINFKDYAETVEDNSASKAPV